MGLKYFNFLFLLGVFTSFSPKMWCDEKGLPSPSFNWNSPFEGWHFYKPREIKQTSSVQKKSSSLEKQDIQKSISYEERLKKWQKTFKEAKARALYEPTFHNIEMVQSLQREITDRALLFGEKWREVSLQKGILEYEQANGNPLYLDIQHIQEEKTLKNFWKQAQNQKFGLFFLTKKGCPYCEKFAPLVGSFSEVSGLSVLEIFDSIPTGYFNARPDNGIIKALNPQGIFPMLFVVDSKRKQFHPLARGLISLSDLNKNALLVFKTLHKQGIL